MNERRVFNREATIYRFLDVICQREGATDAERRRLERIADVLRELWKANQPEGSRSLDEAALGYRSPAAGYIVFK